MPPQDSLSQAALFLLSSHFLYNFYFFYFLYKTATMEAALSVGRCLLAHQPVVGEMIVRCFHNFLKLHNFEIFLFYLLSRGGGRWLTAGRIGSCWDILTENLQRPINCRPAPYCGFLTTINKYGNTNHKKLLRIQITINYYGNTNHNQQIRKYKSQYRNKNQPIAKKLQCLINCTSAC